MGCSDRSWPASWESASGESSDAVAVCACLILRFVSLWGGLTSIQPCEVAEGRQGEWDAPVQVARLDVAQPLGLTRAEQDEVCRERVVGLEAHDVAHAHTPPRLVDKGGALEDLGSPRVEVRIGLVPFLRAGRA